MMEREADDAPEPELDRKYDEKFFETLWPPEYYAERAKRNLKVGELYLAIDILSACNLPVMDLNGLADPYVEVWINGEKVYKSKKQLSTRNPVWNNEHYETTLRWDDPAPKISFRVWDWDKLSADDYIGEAPLLDELCQKGILQVLSVVDRGQPSTVGSSAGGEAPKWKDTLNWQTDEFVNLECHIPVTQHSKGRGSLRVRVSGLICSEAPVKTGERIGEYIQAYGNRPKIAEGWRERMQREDEVVSHSPLMKRALQALTQLKQPLKGYAEIHPSMPGALSSTMIGGLVLDPEEPPYTYMGRFKGMHEKHQIELYLAKFSDAAWAVRRLTGYCNRNRTIPRPDDEVVFVFMYQGSKKGGTSYWGIMCFENGNGEDDFVLSGTCQTYGNHGEPQHGEGRQWGFWKVAPVTQQRRFTARSQSLLPSSPKIRIK